MTDENDSALHRELAFFGKIAAGVTHEIKNSLATIKEESGLALDILAMAQKGHPLDQGRLMDLMKNINNRIYEADRIVNDLNRFSHGADHPIQTMDLGETMALVARLHNRSARRKRAELSAEPPECKIEVRGNAYLLQHLLSLCLEDALDAAGEGGKVCMRLAEDNGCGCCAIEVENASGTPPGEDRLALADALAETLGCEVEQGPGGRGSVIRVKTG